MANKKNHDYHILEPSIWPLLSAVSAFAMLFGAVLFFHEKSPAVMLIGFGLVLYCMYGWWSDVISESIQIFFFLGFVFLIQYYVPFLHFPFRTAAAPAFINSLHAILIPSVLPEITN